MKKIKIILCYFILFLAMNFVYGITQDIPLDRDYATNTTLQYDINLNGTPTYNGIITNTNLNILNDATLNIYAQIVGNFYSYAAPIFRGTLDQTYIFNGSSKANLNIYYDGTRLGATNNIGGIFLTRKDATERSGNITFNVNTSFKAVDNSNLARGVFIANGNGGNYFFNKNLIVDINNTKPLQDAKGNYFRSIFQEESNANIYVNYDPLTGQTLDPDNIIQLKGDISVTTAYLTLESHSNIFINLTNPQSFLLGKVQRIDFPITDIYLQNGGKWYETDNSTIRTLNIQNPSVNSQTYLDALRDKDTSIIDLFSYASSNIPGVYCPGSNCSRFDEAYTPRTLSVNTITGENGVFRLMADVRAGTTDTISANNVNGAQY
ncbi:hypothetical protein, partial [Helicobacter sp. 11S03491-1]|uniref:hypothetical protein n=1 Tax=Helicobacter sp. 11S03491-1 TaxID=1476196 RepID=UPI001179EFE2